MYDKTFIITEIFISVLSIRIVMVDIGGYIKNVMKKNLINKFAPFHAYEGTEDIDFAKELHIVSDNIFIKYKGNAFTNSGLDILLKKHNIEYVEVVGVDGGACVALTALGAIKNGYKVIVNEAAIGTIDSYAT